MKKFLLIVFVFLFILVPYLKAEEQDISEQLDFQMRWLRYESQKKSAGIGILWSFLIPGGGMFYADNTKAGVAFLTAELALISWYIYEIKKELDEEWWSDKQTNGIPFIPSMLLISIRIIEFLTVVDEIGNYNQNLRRELELEPQIGFYNDKINLSLVYKF